MSETVPDAITRTLAQVANAIRADRMIYQSHMKQEAATANGVPASTYYHLPYADWALIRDEYLIRQQSSPTS